MLIGRLQAASVTAPAWRRLVVPGLFQTLASSGTPGARLHSGCTSCTLQIFAVGWVEDFCRTHRLSQVIASPTATHRLQSLQQHAAFFAVRWGPTAALTSFDIILRQGWRHLFICFLKQPKRLLCQSHHPTDQFSDDQEPNILSWLKCRVTRMHKSMGLNRILSDSVHLFAVCNLALRNTLPAARPLKCVRSTQEQRHTSPHVWAAVQTFRWQYLDGTKQQ